MNAVDANVLVYAVDSDEPVKQALAIELLDRLANTPADARLPWQVAGEYLNCLRRWQSASRITQAVTERYLAAVLAMFPLALPTPNVITLSLDLSSRHSLSHWDSMLLAACIEAGVDTLYSEDFTDGAAYDSVTVVNPFS